MARTAVTSSPRGSCQVSHTFVPAVRGAGGPPAASPIESAPRSSSAVRRPAIEVPAPAALAREPGHVHVRSPPTARSARDGDSHRSPAVVGRSPHERLLDASSRASAWSRIPPSRMSRQNGPVFHRPGEGQTATFADPILDLAVRGEAVAAVCADRLYSARRRRAGPSPSRAPRLACRSRRDANLRWARPPACRSGGGRETVVVDGDGRGETALGSRREKRMSPVNGRSPFRV